MFAHHVVLCITIIVAEFQGLYNVNIYYSFNETRDKAEMKTKKRERKRTNYWSIESFCLLILEVLSVLKRS